MYFLTISSKDDNFVDYLKLDLDSIIEKAAKRYNKNPAGVKRFVVNSLLSALTADIEGEVDYLVSSYREEVEREVSNV
ncbi:MAG: hypothetical protein HPY45_09850 [Anaerolineae bacterium]|nr:hypothetical protein [Anaerolineae bacterium]